MEEVLRERVRIEDSASGVEQFRSVPDYFGESAT